MTQVYPTLRVAPSDKGVLGVVIDAPPMNLIGPQLVRDLVGLLGALESDQETTVVVLESADPDYFVPHVDLTKVVPAPQRGVPRPAAAHQPPRDHRCRPLRLGGGAGEVRLDRPRLDHGQLAMTQRKPGAPRRASEPAGTIMNPAEAASPAGARLGADESGQPEQGLRVAGSDLRAV